MTPKATHHEFAPSSFARLRACPGSFKLSRGIEDSGGEDALEGAAMHKAVEMILTTGRSHLVDMMNSEQQTAVTAAVEYTRGIAPDGWRCEVKLNLLDGFDVLTYGTIDAHTVQDECVVAIDYKFGRNPVPAVLKNDQCRLYAAMLMQQYGKPVEFHICQPRLRAYGNYTFGLDLLPEITSEFRAVETACRAPGLVLNPSEAACQYCPAREKCPATHVF